MTLSARRFCSAIHLGGLTGREALLRTWKRINEHAILTRAAAISFYAIAALVPFMGLLIVLTAHWLPGATRAWGDGSPVEPFEPLGYLLPDDAASLIARELKRLREQPPSGLISLSVAALLWLSSSVFVEIIDAMNVILGVAETRPFWRRRLMAIVMTVIQAAILIATTVTIVAGPQIMKFLGLSHPVSVLVTAVHLMIVFVMVLLSFTLTLHVGPDADQDWVWVTPGSLLGTVVVLGVSLLFRLYVQTWAHYSATYGSLTGIIVLMSWIWLSSVELLVAAELNKVIEDASPLGDPHRQRRGVEKFAAVA